MKLHHLFLPLSLLFTGCASSLPNTDEVKDIDTKHYFVESSFEDGNAGMSWIVKGADQFDFNEFHFEKVDVDETGVDPHVSEGVEQKFASNLQEKLSQRVASKLPSHKTKMLPNRAMDISLTLYDIEDMPENLRVTEVIPVGTVIGAIKYATGVRDRSIRLVASVDLIDDQSKELIARRLFVVNNNGVLENDDSPITLKMLEKNVDTITNQAIDFVMHVAYEEKG
ncbi:hypothetical protein VIN01S_26380 [Vibrio inusitatus NBRC 102082]|uniref:Lipoprotein n=1 Tax=Vibrio inusitatus NBRC 102082 TaxID=1219070 RepID=A0A4Y3I055_9VIBR|nr:DUF3313 family protein [Vibrio inusitatus]GEA51834.1 hypothetical protein VIN01S_26380 [Vibrio inusitatus NBRC 102082]